VSHPSSRRAFGVISERPRKWKRRARVALSTLPLLLVAGCNHGVDVAVERLDVILEVRGAIGFDCSATVMGDYRPGICYTMTASEPLDSWAAALGELFIPEGFVPDDAQWSCSAIDELEPNIVAWCSIEVSEILRAEGVVGLSVEIEYGSGIFSTILSTHDYPPIYTVVLWFQRTE